MTDYQAVKAALTYAHAASIYSRELRMYNEALAALERIRPTDGVTLEWEAQDAAT